MVVDRLIGVVSFFVRPQSSFLRPGPLCSDADARSGCQGWPSLRPCQTKYTDIARPRLEIHEHGGRLDAVGRQRAISGIGVLEAIEVGIEMGGVPATAHARFALDVMAEVFPA
jgi:hypothetical protein